jgi:hypothetical protein
MTVKFANTAYPSTITQALSVTLIHPCKTTIITTTQTISNVIYNYGGPATQQLFTQFSDTVSSQYGVPGLCSLTYTLALSADATAFGVSILFISPNYYIQVLTLDLALMG